MQNTLASFACSYSPNVPEFLTKLNCSIAISTYQAGKLIFISPKNEESLVQLPRTFNKPMGIAYDAKNGKLGLACRNTIEIFKNSKELAYHYPRSPKKYDSLFFPRITYTTGHLDIHDLSFGSENEIYGVNTLFSCITKFDSDYNFTPYWKPKHISKLVGEDSCHLNGMVMLNGKPKYASSFNAGDSHQSWRENITKTGQIIDIDSDEVICKNLGMPHSPDIIDDKLLVLLSATGELIQIDPNNGKTTTIVKLDGFVRGMGYYNDYLFIGLSKLRKNSSTFAKLDIADKANKAGIVIVHLPTGAVCGNILYENSVDEIYDIHILPNIMRPNILNSQMEETYLGVSIPGTSFWGKKNDEKKTS
jgi:uncharacterized protein (TIGR03032 family)